MELLPNSNMRLPGKAQPINRFIEHQVEKTLEP